MAAVPAGCAGSRAGRLATAGMKQRLQFVAAPNDAHIQTRPVKLVEGC